MISLSSYYIKLLFLQLGNVKLMNSGVLMEELAFLLQLIVIENMIAQMAQMNQIVVS